MITMNFKSLCYYVIVATNLLLKPVDCDPCNSFKNSNLQFIDYDTERFKQMIDGCVENKKFGGKKVVAMFMEEQDVQVLGEESITNMDHLRTVSMTGSGLERIIPGAFKNVPILDQVQIRYTKLSEILSGVFNSIPKLKELRVDHNQIDVIETDAFTNLTNLRSVYCKVNKLENWNREWFRDAKHMHLIDFSENKIRTIPRRAFSAMPTLSVIYFDFNEIETIHADAFNGLTDVLYLGLKNNRLKEINNDMFPDGLKIHTLLIGGNHLNYLPNEVLGKLSVQEILTNYNPWKCACLNRIHKWIYTRNATLLLNDSCNYQDKHLPECAVPTSYSHTCEESVDNFITKRYLAEIKKFFADEYQSCIKID